MGFISGLAFGLMAGVAVGSRFTPGGLREELEEFWQSAPAEVRGPGERIWEQVKDRLERSGAAYRATRDETRRRLERELASARKGSG